LPFLFLSLSDSEDRRWPLRVERTLQRARAKAKADAGVRCAALGSALSSPPPLPPHLRVRSCCVPAVRGAAVCLHPEDLRFVLQQVVHPEDGDFALCKKNISFPQPRTPVQTQPPAPPKK
jgi:hypothetical protein